MITFTRLCAVATLLVAAALVPVAAQTPSPPAAPLPADLRAQVGVWIEQERKIAETERAASDQADLLARLQNVLEAERDALQATLQDAREAVTTADAERLRLQEERESLRGAAAVVAEALPALEARVAALVPRLPAPLQATVDPLYRRLGREGASRSERLQNVLGIQTQVDRFARGVNRETTLAEVDGRKVEVTTLYLGLAFGIFADATGEHAGFVRPGLAGWTAQDAPEHAAAIRRAIDIYSDPQRAQLVSLPVDLN